MIDDPGDTSADSAGLGELLAVLHGADVLDGPVDVTCRVWRHRERSHEAFVAHIEEEKRQGASIGGYQQRRGQPGPAESEETIRIRRSGQRVRIEHHGGDRDGAYAVTDGPLWWVWDEGLGARSNVDDPEVGGG